MVRDKTRQVLLLSAGVLFLIGSAAGVGAVPDADDIFEDDNGGPPPHAGGHPDDGDGPPPHPDDGDGPPPHPDDGDDDDEDDAGGSPSHANPDNN